MDISFSGVYNSKGDPGLKALSTAVDCWPDALCELNSVFHSKMAACGCFRMDPSLQCCSRLSSSSSTAAASVAHPCGRTNLSWVPTNLRGWKLSPRGEGVRNSEGKYFSKLRDGRQMVLPIVEKNSDEEGQCSAEDSADCFKQIIVPTLDTQLEQEQYLEEEISLEQMSEEVGTYSDSEEAVDDDAWLSEFQRHLPPEVERDRESWSQVSDFSRLPRNVSRRRVLGAPMLMSLLLAFGCSVPAKKAVALVPADIDLTKTPKTAQFDAADSRLRDAASIFGQALNAATVEEEENFWTQIIEKYEKVDAEWVPDILARAFGNRGNARSRQGQLERALGDYNQSITLAPYAVDPVLNRGVALENLGRFEEATADYEAVLKVDPDDPAAWNNLGNVKAALSQWDDALRSYFRAVQLAPKFSFAAANYALALYQVGRENEAVRQFRSLLRKYPEFADIRAALAVSLYELGLFGEAETNWVRLEDVRYADREWVRNTRRWPPKLASALEDFLDVKRI